MSTSAKTISTSCTRMLSNRTVRENNSEILTTYCELVPAVFASAWPAQAHHSFSAEYDADKPVQVTGMVTKVEWMNPHARFYVDVKGADGKVEQWAFEAGTPSGMLRNGYKPGVIKAGVEVTIKGFRARDVTKTRGMLSQLVTADGQVVGLFGPQENR